MSYGGSFSQDKEPPASNTFPRAISAPHQSPTSAVPVTDDHNVVPRGVKGAPCSVGDGNGNVCHSREQTRMEYLSNVEVVIFGVPPGDLEVSHSPQFFETLLTIELVSVKDPL